MTVHVLMPVFNRLQMTRDMLTCLRGQVLDQPMSITVVDDGSTDGTGDFLASQADVHVLRGDGNLWWGGAIDLALRDMLQTAGPQDWVAFVNNDTWFGTDFLQQLLDVAKANAPAAVGSILRDAEPPHRLLSIAAAIDGWKMVISDQLAVHGSEAGVHEVFEVDALSGRGVLYPAAALIAAGGMRPSWLPHYLADYEVALRVHQCGYRLLVSAAAPVFSAHEDGSAYRPKSLRERLFSVRTPTYLPALVKFWWEASNWAQRLSLPVRLGLFVLFPRFRRGAQRSR
jgi:GT2 family glycosyltransferase